jgi:hypothetical protein
MFLIDFLCAGESVQLLKPGDEVELKCQLDPPVQWFKDNAIVSTGTHHLVNHNNGTLTIFKVLTSECTVSCIQLLLFFHCLFTEPLLIICLSFSGGLALRAS